ncbi:MAG: hypothetical protein OSJ70_04170 [Bacilli bacterium]|nr:hypothetical protein [Bacilli bacterium]
MNKIKSFFAKEYLSHNIRWQKNRNYKDKSVFYFQYEVRDFLQFLENRLDYLLNSIFLDFGLEVKIDKNKSGNSFIYFYNCKNPNDEYMLFSDRVVSHSPSLDENVLNKINSKKSQLESLFNYYKDIVEKCKTKEIPLVKNIFWCYDFFGGTYFLLKNRKGRNKIKFYRSTDIDNFFDKDDNEERIFADGTFYEMIDKFSRIPNNHYEEYQALKSTLTNGENLLCDKVHSEVKKMEEIQGVEKQIQQKLLEMIALQEQLGDLTNIVKRVSIPEKNLFEKIDGVTCIKECFQPYLRYIDLSQTFFDNVYIAGLDFSHTNAKINPQTVYNKDLSNCRFVTASPSDNIFSAFSDFRGCNLAGTFIDDAPVTLGISDNSNCTVIKKYNN